MGVCVWVGGCACMTDFVFVDMPVSHCWLAFCFTGSSIVCLHHGHAAAQGMHAIRDPEMYGIVPSSKHHRDVIDDCISEAK